MTAQVLHKIDWRERQAQRSNGAGRLAQVLETATRRDTRAQQRLAQIRRTALIGAGALVAAVSAAEAARRGSELRRLGEQVERLADTATGRAKKRAKARSRRRLLIAGAGAGVLGGATTAMLTVRRLRDRSAEPASPADAVEEAEAMTEPEATAVVFEEEQSDPVRDS